MTVQAKAAARTHRPRIISDRSPATSRSWKKQGRPPPAPTAIGVQGPADTLTADFQALEMRDNTLLLFQATCSHSTNLPSSSSMHTLCWVLGTHPEARRPGSGLAQGAIVMERLELEAGKGRTRLSRMGRASGPARWGLWDRPQRPSCLT